MLIERNHCDVLKMFLHCFSELCIIVQRKTIIMAQILREASVDISPPSYYNLSVGKVDLPLNMPCFICLWQETVSFNAEL